jgi:hypothetical protein
MSLWDHVTNSQASTTTTSEPKPKKHAKIFARDGIPLDLDFVMPEPQPGKIDILWECTGCEIQEMEFNMAPILAETAPIGWETITDQLAEDDDDPDHFCPTCKNLFKWI